MKINLITVIVAAFSFISTEIKAQSLIDNDVCFYTAMFRDETSGSPFAVVEVMFENVEHTRVIVARNGFLASTLREAGLNFDEGYVKTMLELKRKKEPLVLPIELEQKLELYILQSADSCSVAYSLQELEQRDRYVKFRINVKQPLGVENQKCLVYDLYKKRELVMTFSESGAYYIPYLECH